MKKRILLKGPFQTSSGYGVHSRQIARWAFDNHESANEAIDCLQTNWGDTPWILNPEYGDGLIGKVFQNSVAKPEFDTNLAIQIQLPNEWERYVGVEKHIGVTAGIEVTKCNPTWRAGMEAMDMVIVPSEFTKQSLLTAWENEEPKARIEVVPESFIDEILQSPKPLDLNLECDFNFLVVGQLTGNTIETDRKNIFNTIRWFCQAFAGDKNTGLVIKTNQSRNTSIDRKVCAELLLQAVQGSRKGDFPRVHLLHGNLSDEEMAGLYAHPKIKAFISLTHGEGFGIPLLEAAASGLPVIATAWSAHTEFLSKGRYRKVDYTLKPIPESKIDGKLFVPGAAWAYPSEQDFKKHIVKLRESYSMPLQWAKDLQKIIHAEYSFEAISKRYENLLSEFL